MSASSEAYSHLAKKKYSAILVGCLLCTNNYDIFAIRKVLSVEYWVVRLQKCQLGALKRTRKTNGPSLEATPVNPEQNGLSPVSSLGFGPDVECQAILALLVAGLADLCKQADSVGARQSSRISRTRLHIGGAVPANSQSATTPPQSRAAKQRNAPHTVTNHVSINSPNGDLIYQFTYAVALIVPVPENARGAAKRRFPRGGCAKGIPRY